MMVLVLFLLGLLILALVLALRHAETAREDAGLPPDTMPIAVDLGDAPRERGIYGLTLRDAEWGLVGRPDLLLESPQGPIPVENKRAPRSWRPGWSSLGHRLQIGTYVFMCEVDPQVARRSPEGRLRYLDPDGRLLPGAEVRVPNTEALRREVLDVVQRMRRDLQAPEVHRSHSSAGRCHGCSVRLACGEALEWAP